MEKVRVGVIGIGNIGSAHVNFIASGAVENMQLTALCDINDEKINLLKEKYPNIPVFKKYEDLLKSGLTDAIIVSTPHYLHPIIAIEGFKYSQNVLIEKPAGVYTSIVEKMNEEAKKSGKVFAIMFNQRTDPLFIKAREIVKSGKLGIPKRLVWIITNWYRTQAYYNSGEWRATWNGEGGGVLLNQAPHNLDLLQWIFGVPKRVRGFCTSGKYHNISVEDDATIYAEYENGATATFITSTGECPGTNRLEICGDLGKIVLEEGKLKWYKLPKAEREICFTEENGFYEPKVEIEEYSYKSIDGHQVIIRNFANAILNNEPLIANGFEGINSLMISNATYLSSWTDSWVDIPLNQKEFENHLKELCEKEKLDNKLKSEEKMSDNYNQRWQVRW